MRANKPGLADLKRLRELAQKAAEPEPPPVNPVNKASHKRKKMLAPNPGATSTHGAPGAPDRPAPATGHVPSTTDLSEAGADHVGTPVAEADKALFRRVMQAVHRLPDANRATLPPVPLAPQNVLQQKRIAASGVEPASLPSVSDDYTPKDLTLDPTQYVREGHGTDLVKNLAQGKWPIEATLDLHGATLDEARPRLHRFLQSCLDHKIKCVRIVHGKGHGSKGNTPILKDTVRRWLTQLQDIKAYAECAERDGGAGAVIALLRVKED